MGGVTKYSHKGLCQIAGKSILAHAISSIRAAGVSQIYIVTGYRAELVQRTLGDAVTYLFNPFYEVSGILGSFWQAMPVLDGKPFLFTTADHFFSAPLVRRCLEAKGDVVSLVQQKRRYDAEDSKVLIKQNRITRFGKDMPVDEAAGEYAAMTVFRSRASAMFFAELRNVFGRGELGGYAMDILNSMLDQPDLCMAHILCDESSRIEIDSVADLRRARRLADSIMKQSEA